MKNGRSQRESSSARRLAFLAILCQLGACTPPPSGGGGSAPQASATVAELTVSGLEPLEFHGAVGGPFVGDGSRFRLENHGGGSIYWLPRTDVDWLKVTPTLGQLAGGAEVEVSVELDSERARVLPAGRHAAELRILDRSRGRSAARIDVTLWIGNTLEEGSWLRAAGAKLLPVFVWKAESSDTWIDYYRGLGIDTWVEPSDRPEHADRVELLKSLTTHGAWAVLPHEVSLPDLPALVAWSVEGTSAEELFDVAARARAESGGLPLFSASRPPVGTETPEVAQRLAQTVDLAGEGFDGTASAAAGPARALAPRPLWRLIELPLADDSLGIDPARVLERSIWSALVRGATAIGYDASPEAAGGLSGLDGELEAVLVRTHAALGKLASVLLGKPPTLAVAVRGPGASALSYCVRGDEQHAWLFVVNESNEARTLSARFRLDRAPVVVRNWQSDRVLRAEGESFEDELEPAAVRIYEIQL